MRIIYQNTKIANELAASEARRRSSWIRGARGAGESCMRRVALDASIDFPAAAKVTRFAATKVARSTRVQPKNALNPDDKISHYFWLYFPPVMPIRLESSLLR